MCPSCLVFLPVWVRVDMSCHHQLHPALFLPLLQAPRKRAAATSAVAALSTPAGATIKAADKGKEVPAKPPSSAGHTPMDRLTHLAKSKSTPLPGFPGFTPPVTALRDNGTPNAKLGLFRAGSRTPEDGADRCGPMEVDRSGSVRFNQSGATGTPGGATTPGVSSFSAGTPLSPPPDSAAKAALQEALDMTPGAEGGKAGRLAHASSADDGLGPKASALQACRYCIYPSCAHSSPLCAVDLSGNGLLIMLCS